MNIDSELERILISKEIYLDGKVTDTDRNEYVDEYICFVVGGETYGVHVALVDEIINAENITEVPGSQDHLAGIVNLRGKMIALWDLKALFQSNVESVNPKNKIVVIDYQSRTIGFLVEEIIGIQAFTDEQILDAKEVIALVEGKPIKMIARRNGQLVIIPDLGEILIAN